MRQCTLEVDGCISSTSYPSSYPDDDSCSIHVPAGNTDAIHVVSFDTESSDKLRVNDVDYSGTSGPDGVVPQGTIGWSSEPWMPVRNRYLVFTVGGGFKIPWLRGRLDQPPRLENLPARDAGGIM